MKTKKQKQEYGRKWRANNPDYQRKWREDNPAYGYIMQAKYRQLKKQAE